MKLDKRVRAEVFRRRLAAAMRDKGETRSGLARNVGVDRSTVSQLLSPRSARLPNAQVVAECAAALGVSGDWLLGLSDLPERAADLLAASTEISSASRLEMDQQLLAWHREAAGYKIRSVPARLPDILKTNEMIAWEYAPHLGKTAEQAVGASGDRLDLMRDPLSDYEIAVPLFEIDSLVAGEGYYRSLPAPVRRAQVARLRELYDQLYPSLRIYLYDARRLFSSPITVFGPLVAVLYIGQSYLAFRDSERVRALTLHFDALVREAAVSSSDFPRYLERAARATG